MTKISNGSPYLDLSLYGFVSNQAPFLFSSQSDLHLSTCWPKKGKKGEGVIAGQRAHSARVHARPRQEIGSQQRRRPMYLRGPSVALGMRPLAAHVGPRMQPILSPE